MSLQELMDIGLSGPTTEGRGSGEGGEALYLKSGDEGVVVHQNSEDGKNVDIMLIKSESGQIVDRIGKSM
ncbi:hypothetical protein L1987_32755 [Smallanthus sonchifolius]|uniref:Uncharacterized protein n=1 Tax=Smallanthus sonchifolius TaxID=185202 RepID=A0ACB9HNG2_9ASTR|nr:hypothetical protein L1987_32755 [Smallanthus sonchifolius]